MKKKVEHNKNRTKCTKSSFDSSSSIHMQEGRNEVENVVSCPSCNPTHENHPSKERKELKRFLVESSEKMVDVHRQNCTEDEVIPGPQVQNLFPDGYPPYLRSEKKRTFFKECAVAGWNFYIERDFWPELVEGTQLVLVRDKDNTNDKHAVAVMLENDYDGDPENVDMDFIIGYVPRTENLTIAQMMDMGWFDVFTAELTTVKNHGSYDERLRMTIYIQSKDEVLVDDHPEERIFGMLLDDEGILQLENSLHNSGSVYYRWGGFPVWERCLPQEKNKVLVINRREKDAQIYLMHVIAIDDKAAPFLDNPEEELNMVDDCCPYVLTNVKGPIFTSLKDIEFLDTEPISEGQPDGCLSDRANQQLNILLNSSTKIF